jgi:hypothetical protein
VDAATSARVHWPCDRDHDRTLDIRLEKRSDSGYPVVINTQETTVQDNQKNLDRELSDADLELVSGGINPQPLPPRNPPEERLK